MRSMQMDTSIHPMTLGDIFDRTFRLIGKTVLRNVTVAIIFLIVPTFFIVFAIKRMFNIVGDFGGWSGDIRPEIGFSHLMALAGSFSILACAILLFSICLLFAEISIMIIVGKEMMSETISVGEAFEETFNKKWLYGIGQALLKGLVLVAGSIASVIIFLIIAFATGRSTAGTAIAIFLFVVVLVVVVVFFTIRWYFSLAAVSIEGIGPVESLRKSWNLVEGHWWRTLGILILLGIASQFVISMVTMPVMFGSMWNFYKELFSMMGRTGGDLDPRLLSELQRSLGPTIALSSGLTNLLSLLITPVFVVIMYFDLRARKNDLSVPPPADTTPAITPPPVQ